MKPLWQIADFLKALRRRLRFGELSRAPLELMRLELRGKDVECEWIVRPADAWDASLHWRERERNVSQQALRDAVEMRDLILVALPQVDRAVLRAFRPFSAREPPEVVIVGSVSRSDVPALRVKSWAMKAKLYGLQFHLDDGILQPLEREEIAVSEVLSESTLSA